MSLAFKHYGVLDVQHDIGQLFRLPKIESRDWNSCNSKLSYFAMCDEKYFTRRIDDCVELQGGSCFERLFEMCGTYRKHETKQDDESARSLTSTNQYYGADLNVDTGILDITRLESETCGKDKRPENSLRGEMYKMKLRSINKVDIGEVGRNARWIAAFPESLVVGDRNTSKISAFKAKKMAAAEEMSFVEPDLILTNTTGAFENYFGENTSAGQVFANPFKHSLFSIRKDGQMYELDYYNGFKIASMESNKFDTAMKSFLKGSALRDTEVCGFHFITKKWLRFHTPKTGHRYLMKLNYDKPCFVTS